MLLEHLLRQTWHPERTEIIVVEQSTRVPPEAAARFEELARDPRIVVLRHPPLGGARARNVGVERARGDIIVLIDDDDLPAHDDFIARHVAAYDDPRCLGVSGKHIYNDEVQHRYAPWFERFTKTLSYDPILKMPLTYVQHDHRRIPVYAIHGTNASIRRSAYERFGGWDTDTAIEDEVSFCLRALARKEPCEYFAYDPRAVLLRNRDVAGGLDKRQMSASVYLGHFLDFVHRILGRYHTARVVALYPLYMLVSYIFAVGWLHKNTRRYTRIGLVAASLWMFVSMPVHIARAWGRLARPQAAVAAAAVVLTPPAAPASATESVRQA